MKIFRKSAWDRPMNRGIRQYSIGHVFRWRPYSVSNPLIAKERGLLIRLAEYRDNCRRFYPKPLTVDSFEMSDQSPRGFGDGPAWSIYYDKTTATVANPTGDSINAEKLPASFRPTTLDQCITGCQSIGGANYWGVVWSQGARTSSCSCIRGHATKDTPQISRSNKLPDGTVTVLFRNCVDTTTIRERTHRTRVIS